MGMITRLEKSKFINNRYRLIELKDKFQKHRYFIVDYSNPRKIYNYSAGVVFLKNSFDGWEISIEDLKSIRIQKTGEIIQGIQLHNGSHSYFDDRREKTKENSLKYKLSAPITKDNEYLFWIVPPFLVPILEFLSPDIEISGVISWILLILIIVTMIKIASALVKKSPRIETQHYKKVKIKQKHDNKRLLFLAPIILAIQIVFIYLLLNTIFINFDIFAYVLFMFGVVVFSIPKFFGNISDEADIEVIEM